jgi:hypothetical protein
MEMGTGSPHPHPNYIASYFNIHLHQAIKVEANSKTAAPGIAHLNHHSRS